MDTSLEEAERTPLVRRHLPKSVRQTCFVWRAYADRHPLVLTCIEVSLGVLVWMHPGLTLLMVLSALFHLPFKSTHLLRSLTLLPLVLLSLEVATLCVVLIFVIYSDFSKRRVRGVTVWQREALGRIIRNLTVSLLLGLTTWKLYTHLTFSVTGPELTGKLLSVLFPALLLCGISVLKLALIRTEDGFYWLTGVVATGLFLVMAVGKVDYQATFTWAGVLYPLLGVLVVASFACLHGLYQTCFYPEKETRFAQAISKSSDLVAIFVLAVAISHLQRIESSDSDPLMSVAILLLGFGVLSVVLSLRTGRFLLDIIWGHVEVDFLYSKNPVNLSRSRSV